MFYLSKLLSLLQIVNRVVKLQSKHTSAKKVLPKKNKYSNTVLLPRTDFPLWVSGPKRVDQDEKIIKECGFSTLYNWQREHVKGPEFVLHDGPPYANGMPHMGHAINKILKDITTRHKLLQGHKIHYVPGWDCHGLPIELKAMAGQDVSSLSPLTIRNQARKFAKEAITDQKTVFRSWGVMADWEKGCYHTFDKSYTKNQLHQFYRLYEQKLVYRDVKPVFWSPSSRTALAESELEYNEHHVSTAAHVRVRVENSPAKWSDTYAIVWTTTPWTLVANQAIAYSPSLTYCLVTLGEKGEERYIVAKDLVDHLSKILQRRLVIVADVNSSTLSSLSYQHPFNPSQSLTFLPSDHVKADKGTGLVHIAPAHGHDDFKLARKFNLPISCLVDEAGCYTDEVDASLRGLSVLTEGSQIVLEMCREKGSLVHASSFEHSYPYDWRTNLPVILRASLQWFFDTAVVKQKAVEALKDVTILPKRGMSGLVSQVQSRPFWCISRQRVWGVAIPVLYTSSGQPIISRKLIDHYCHLLDTIGDDFWWTSSLDDLAPPQLLAELNVDPKDIHKSQDILDIWLDSGLSWSAVLDTSSADLYLEGVDQFNGWFQSSLMTSIALQNVSPYRSVFVHGFAVDENGLKMSKSIGNVINPQDIVCGGPDSKRQPVYGVDALRWWVAAHATQQSSVAVSTTTLANSKDCVQKLRATLRFLLGGLKDLPSQRHFPHLRHLDLYMLHCLRNLELQVMELYNNYQYNHVCSNITNFVANQVSAQYCHLTKDRLYCEPEDSDSRRSVQLTMYHTLSMLSRLIAPILPVLAEEVFRHQPVKESEYLFHRVGAWSWSDWHKPDVATLIEQAFDIKQQVAKLSPLNCSSWELAVNVSTPTSKWEQLKFLQSEEESTDSELAEILQVSHVTLVRTDSVPDVQVDVTLIHASQCERCRKYTVPNLDSLCPRCNIVLGLGK